LHHYSVIEVSIHTASHVYRLTACLTHTAENPLLAVCARQRQLLLFVDGIYAQSIFWCFDWIPS